MRKLMLALCCVFMLCGCNGERSAKSYQNVVETFEDYGFKEKDISINSDSNKGTYEFKLNDENYIMFFKYDNEKNKAIADVLYYPTGKSSSTNVYKNTELEDNKNFKYENIESDIKKRLDKSLDEMDVTYEEFSDWCTKMIAKKDFSKYVRDNLTGVEYLNFVFGKDLEVKDLDSVNGGILIKDKKYVILIKGELIYAIDRSYDFIKGTGYMYVPEYEAGGYNEGGQFSSIYDYESNSVILGSMSQEDKDELSGIKKWYDGILKMYDVTTEDLKQKVSVEKSV